MPARVPCPELPLSVTQGIVTATGGEATAHQRTPRAACQLDSECGGAQWPSFTDGRDWTSAPPIGRCSPARSRDLRVSSLLKEDSEAYRTSRRQAEGRAGRKLGFLKVLAAHTTLCS